MPRLLCCKVYSKWSYAFLDRGRPFCSSLVTRCLSLITCHSLLVIRYSSIVTRYKPTRYFLQSTRYFYNLLVVFYNLLVAFRSQLARCKLTRACAKFAWLLLTISTNRPYKYFLQKASWFPGNRTRLGLFQKLTCGGGRWTANFFPVGGGTWRYLSLVTRYSSIVTRYKPTRYFLQSTRYFYNLLVVFYNLLVAFRSQLARCKLTRACAKFAWLLLTISTNRPYKYFLQKASWFPGNRTRLGLFQKLTCGGGRWTANFFPVGGGTFHN